MKKIIAFGIINLILTLGMAQSDVNNQKKYWNFRNRFKQNFIRIGPSDGEIPFVLITFSISLPMCIII